MDNKTIALSQTMDAQEWAKEFKRLFPEADEGLMLCWFANAIMCGWDHARRKQDERIKKIDEITQEYKYMSDEYDEVYREGLIRAKEIILGIDE